MRNDSKPPRAAGLAALIACAAATDVLLASGVQCFVFGGVAIPPQVLITWDPPPAGLAVEGIEVLRDGVMDVLLPAGTSMYSEEPEQGAHTYTVVAVAVKGTGNDVTLGDCVADYEPPVIDGFIRADPNGDEAWDLGDPVFTLVYLFLGGPAPLCAESADADDSGGIDVSDAVYELEYLFAGGQPPPAPFPDCGHDGTPDALGCDVYTRCFTPPPP